MVGLLFSLSGTEDPYLGGDGCFYLRKRGGADG